MSKTKLVPYFPSGVYLKHRTIYDDHLNTSLPINRTAEIMLTEVDGKKNMEEIIHNLSQKFNIDEDTLFRDTAVLFGELNRNYKLNWKYKTGIKVKDGIFQFLSQYIPRYQERFDIQDINFLFIFMKMLKVIIRKLILFWAIFIVLSILSYSYAKSDFILKLDYYLTIAYVGVIISCALHEALHAYVQRKITNHHPGFIAADWMSLCVVRPIIMPYPKKLILVTLAGPLIPGIIGIFGILFTQLADHSGIIANTLNIIFITFALHIFFLLPFFGDGKSIIKQIFL